MSARDAARLLGVSHQRVHQIVEHAEAGVGLARQLGVPIPAGWAVDSQGVPITEPPAQRSVARAQTPLGNSLEQGGHLTHGLPVNFSGRLFEAHAYGLVPETGEIDYDAALEKAKEVRPRGIIAGASAYSRFTDFKRFGRSAGPSVAG